jgi:hypothetical protein
MEASAKFARKGPVILAIPANRTLTYLSVGPMDTGASVYFSVDYLNFKFRQPKISQILLIKNWIVMKLA